MENMHVALPSLSISYHSQTIAIFIPVLSGCHWNHTRARFLQHYISFTTAALLNSLTRNTGNEIKLYYEVLFLQP